MKEFSEDEGDDDDYEHEGDMPWEAAAKQAIDQAIEGMEFDEVRGTICILSWCDSRFNGVTEEFKNFDDLYFHLLHLAENEWCNYAPYDGGSPVFEPDVEDMVGEAMRDADEFFISMARPRDAETAEEIINAKSILTPGSGIILKADFSEINAELVRYLTKHPEKMREMDSYKFESLIAELLKDKGYDVEQTQRTRDGGYDIRAVYKSELGTFLTLVDCKRYSEKRNVSVEVVRGLYGVVEKNKATSGLIVTTSSFTKDARTEQNSIRNRFDLVDFEGVKKWLNRYKGQ